MKYPIFSLIVSTLFVNIRTKTTLRHGAIQKLRDLHECVRSGTGFSSNALRATRQFFFFTFLHGNCWNMCKYNAHHELKKLLFLEIP
jgi:hypothetical protein